MKYLFIGSCIGFIIILLSPIIANLMNLWFEFVDSWFIKNKNSKIIKKCLQEKK